MDDDLDDVFRERRRLLALGYRMTGTLADAEDVVQETYLRWYRLTEDERAAVANPAGWLTTVAGRVALDFLGSARRRREQYVGPWLPEPVPAELFAGAIGSRTATPSDDPLDRITLDDEVSTALLVVLEAMTPAERVAFVLHDVFAVPFDDIAEIVGRTPEATRQLASRARRRVQGSSPMTDVDLVQHREVVDAFLRAAQGGDFETLVQLLAPDVVLRPDAAALSMGSLTETTGAMEVATMLAGGARAGRRAVVDGLASIAWAPGGRVRGFVEFTIVDGRIVALDVTGDHARIERADIVLLDA
jgi:RNA polymerase sigma factor (sigma-70 family)